MPATAPASDKAAETAATKPAVNARRRLDALRVNVDVVDADVAHPGRTDARFARIFGDRHQPADHGRSLVMRRTAAMRFDLDSTVMTVPAFLVNQGVPSPSQAKTCRDLHFGHELI
jgi:hypothetical protein